MSPRASGGQETERIRHRMETAPAHWGPCARRAPRRATRKQGHSQRPRKEHRGSAWPPRRCTGRATRKAARLLPGRLPLAKTLRISFYQKEEWVPIAPALWLLQGCLILTRAEGLQGPSSARCGTRPTPQGGNSAPGLGRDLEPCLMSSLPPLSSLQGADLCLPPGLVQLPRDSPGRFSAGKLEERHRAVLQRPRDRVMPS